MVERSLEKYLLKNMFKGKIILLTGARQVGKTTLLKQLIAKSKKKSIWLNADEGDVRNDLNNATTSTQLLNIFGDSELIIIDEAQQINNIGLKLKLIIDTYPNLQVIATGSSSFDLLNKSNEPLTGRKIELQLFPLCFTELANNTTTLNEKRNLEKRLIYGSYPAVVNNAGNEVETLSELINSYLYKDLLRFDGIKKSALIDKLLLALALQVGSEVKTNELAKTIGNVDPATIDKYISLLEKCFVIFKLPALNRNLRNEIKKGKKIYFYDNGVLNLIIKNFNPINMRQDKGALWENYIISERYKRNAYQKHLCNTYFWRTFDQAEVDYIEEYGGKLHTYEFKWKTNRKKIPASLETAYDIGSTNFIDTENYVEFINT